MFGLNRHLPTLACLALLSGCSLSPPKWHHPIIMSPCELQEPCVFKDAVTVENDYGSSHVTLVDQTGRMFIVAYVGPGVLFKRQNGTTAKSLPGSPEEQCVLAILKTSYTAAFNPPMKEPPKDAE